MPQYVKKHPDRNRFIDNQDGTYTLRVVRLNGKEFDFLIDTTDVGLVQRHVWHVTTGENPQRHIYAVTNKDYSLGRYILNLPPAKTDDRWCLYIDNNSRNCCRSNLRVVTFPEISHTHPMPTRNKFGRNIRSDRPGAYYSGVQRGGRMHWTPTRHSLQEAIADRDNLIARLDGGR